jgi:hypothetical protein
MGRTTAEVLHLPFYQPVAEEGMRSALQHAKQQPKGIKS